MSYLDKYLSTNNNKSEAIAFYASLDVMEKSNPIVAKSIIDELKAQRSNLKMIASENYSSLAVQLAMSNLLTDKYAEGYVKHRFYAGCENVDLCEQEAIDQLTDVFNCEHAYVQPHSGADANLVAIWSVLVEKIQNKEIEKLGKKKLDELSESEYEEIRQLMVNSKIMGMSLNSGGHLTHGYRHNISSKMMRSCFYDIDPKTETLDYLEVLKKAKEEKPTILLAGYSSYSRQIDFAKMKEIADEVKAALMVDMAHFSGLVAGKVFKGNFDPVPYADIVTSTTHKTLRGPRGGIVMCKKELAQVVNKGCPLVLGGPLPHVIAAKAIAFKEVNSKEFQAYAQQVVKNAKALAEVFLKENFHIMSGGTDNHMVILDVTKFNITGRQAESALIDCHITCNRNAIFNDKNGPWYTSGIRLGTPALTTLGMKEEEMRLIAKLIIEVLKNTRVEGESLAKFKLDQKIKEKVQAKVKELLLSFPLYPSLNLEF